jgi:hypothetical protein
MNNLKIEHLGDEHQLPAGEWTCESWANWLHPLNGPFPDHVFLLSCVGETFKVALWDLSTRVITATEILDRPRTLAEIERASKLGGWVLTSRSWKPLYEPLAMESDGLKVYSPESLKDEPRQDWLYRFFIETAKGAVRLAVTRNIGGYNVGEPR